MGEKIGLDFGTAYTLLSRINLGNDNIFEDIKPDNSKPEYRDSIAVKDGNNWKYGSFARGQLGEHFTDFKMLLKDPRDEVLEKMGYTKEYTPSRITADYLNNIFNSEFAQRGKSVEKVVIGVPEVWLKNQRGYQSRIEFERIIREEVDAVDSYVLHGEPILACAYFVYKLSKEKGGGPFEGDVVVIDYGGGTLDITVCEVEVNNNKYDIKPVYRGGSGQNAIDEKDFDLVGKAGHAFLSEVVRLVAPDESNNKEVLIAYRQQLEDQLLSPEAKVNIKGCFDYIVANGIKIDDNHKIWDTIIATIGFPFPGSKRYAITAKTIQIAYDNVIKEELKKQLDEVYEEYFAPRRKKVKDSQNKSIKIIQIGGFSKFYLNQLEINRYFDFAGVEARDGDRIIGYDNIDKAVSYGAALVANDLVLLHHVTEFAIGIAKYNANVSDADLNRKILEDKSSEWKKLKELLKEKSRKDVLEDNSFWAIPSGIIVKPDQPLYIQDYPKCKRDKYGIPLKNEPHTFIATEGIIRYLAICWDKNPKDVQYAIFEPPEEYKQYFKVKKHTGYNIGFSLDNSGILSLHLKNVETGKEEMFRIKDVEEIINEQTGGLV